MIEFAEDDERDEWPQVFPLLQEIVRWVHTQCWPIDKRFVITSIARTLAENARAGAKTLIHVVGPPWRAVDVSARDIEQATVSMVAALVNRRWTYDPDRPKIPICYSDPHGTGPHLHFQVMPGKTQLSS